MITALDIQDQVHTDLLDYQQLMSCLETYAKPRDRISSLLADAGLIRIRKGLYALGDRYRRAPLSRELLANLIYGPSYVSLDYALSRYGIIPERVENVTSVTTGERRRFSTPFGVFTYCPLILRRYTPGIQWQGEGESRYLMASPEKALVDKVWSDKRFYPTSRKDLHGYLMEDLRTDEALLAALDQARIAEIAAAFASRKINLLARYLFKLQGVQA